MTKSLDSRRLVFFIECRKDDLGKEMYYVSFASTTIRFRNFDSVLDFVTNNKDLGYVQFK